MGMTKKKGLIVLIIMFVIIPPLSMAIKLRFTPEREIIFRTDQLPVGYVTAFAIESLDTGLIEVFAFEDEGEIYQTLLTFGSYMLYVDVFEIYNSSNVLWSFHYPFSVDPNGCGHDITVTLHDNYFTLNIEDLCLLE